MLYADLWTGDRSDDGVPVEHIGLLHGQHRRGIGQLGTAGPGGRAGLGAAEHRHLRRFDAERDGVRAGRWGCERGPARGVARVPGQVQPGDQHERERAAPDGRDGAGRSGSRAGRAGRQVQLLPEHVDRMPAKRGRRGAGQGRRFADPLGPGGRRARSYRKRHCGGRSPGAVPAGRAGRAHG